MNDSTSLTSHSAEHAVNILANAGVKFDYVESEECLCTQAASSSIYR
jgi:hypothetical protein